MLLNVIVKSGLVKSLLRDPSLEENTSFFLKWFCCYLGVYLLQPRYILSANSEDELKWIDMSYHQGLVKENVMSQSLNRMNGG